MRAMFAELMWYVIAALLRKSVDIVDSRVNTPGEGDSGLRFTGPEHDVSIDTQRTFSPGGTA